MAKGVIIDDQKLKMKVLRQFINKEILFTAVKETTFQKWIGGTKPTAKTLTPFCKSVGLCLDDIDAPINRFAQKIASITQHEVNDVLGWINRLQKMEQKTSKFPFDISGINTTSNLYFLIDSVDLYGAFFKCCDAVSNHGKQLIIKNIALDLKMTWPVIRDIIISSSRLHNMTYQGLLINPDDNIIASHCNKSLVSAAHAKELIKDIPDFLKENSSRIREIKSRYINKKI